MENNFTNREMLDYQLEEAEKMTSLVSSHHERYRGKKQDAILIQVAQVRALIAIARLLEELTLTQDFLEETN